MCAHDAVAQKDFYPHLPEIPVEVDEDEETIKIVQLVKSNEPLVSSTMTRVNLTIMFSFCSSQCYMVSPLCRSFYFRFTILCLFPIHFGII